MTLGNTSDGGGKANFSHCRSSTNHVSAQVCWIPIVKSAKLILAGDPLQVSSSFFMVNLT